MRSVILVLATIGLLGGAFLLYAMLQSSPPAMEGDRGAAPAISNQPAPRPRQPAAATQATAVTAEGAAAIPAQPRPADASDRIIGGGENVWVKSFNKSNRLVNEFRAAKYDPKGEVVQVTSPQARFYLEDGAVLLIEAARGQVIIPSGSGQRETMRDARNQTPTRGELYDVTLSLLKSLDATDPILRCTMNNIVFDNDTFRIATEAYTDGSGQTIPADRVPVTVRGVDYDFDGYGLVIRWNELDQRLQLLEIARGDRLVVKNPNALKLAKIAPSAGGDAAAAAEPIQVTWAGPLRVVPGKVSKTIERQHYRAMLTDNVKITQAAAELATADVLEIAFSVEPEDKPAAGRERPVVVSLTGAPAVVSMQGMQARAAVVSFDTASGSATLRSSPEFPQIALQDSTGQTMFARQVEYDPAKGTAVLTGPAKFEVRLPPDAADKSEPRTLVADASRSCVITFDTSQKEPVIKSATLSGDVTIDHPQVKLTCETIDLAFAAGAGSRELSFDRVAADGKVRANLIGADGRQQKIQCQSLKLKTRPGRPQEFLPESFGAQGDVVIESPQQTVRAGKLEVTFAPGSPGDAIALLSLGDSRIASLQAEKDVSFVAPDGGGIWADRVTLNAGPEVRPDIVRVEGKPARIGDSRGMLLASVIDFDPATGDAAVLGGGKFETAFAAAGDQPATPGTVSWAGDLKFNAATGTAAVTDGVSLSANQPDGTSVSGTANSLILAFESPNAASRPSAAPMASRRVRDVNLSGDVKFAAVQSDAAGEMRQRMNLFCEKLVYQPVGGQVIVPVGGRMLVEDRRPEAGGQTNTGMRSPRGATAFQWNDKLSFSPADNRAEMAGGVVVVHQPLSPGESPIRMTADVVLAELATGESANDSQLRSVSARGDVRFTTEKLEFSAAETEFRPMEDVVIARGDDRAPAVLLDEQGMSRGSFSELWLNTRTQESQVRDFRAVVRP